MHGVLSRALRLQLEAVWRNLGQMFARFFVTVDLDLWKNLYSALCQSPLHDPWQLQGPHWRCLTSISSLGRARGVRCSVPQISHSEVHRVIDLSDCVSLSGSRWMARSKGPLQ